MASAAPGGAPWRDALERLSLNEWTLLVTLAFWIWFGLLIARELVPRWRDGLRIYLWVAWLAGVVSLGLAATSFHALVRVGQGVVVKDEAQVRYGPLRESRTYYTARDGQEVTVLNQREDWVQIRDGLGKVGWIAKASLLVMPKII